MPSWCPKALGAGYPQKPAPGNLLLVYFKLGVTSLSCYFISMVKKHDKCLDVAFYATHREVIDGGELWKGWWVTLTGTALAQETDPLFITEAQLPNWKLLFALP